MGRAITVLLDNRDPYECLVGARCDTFWLALLLVDFRLTLVPEGFCKGSIGSGRRKACKY